MNPSELEKLLHHQIPLSKAMDVRVIKADDSWIELNCLLAPNHNHIGTAFGGSLSTLMILAAYCRLFVMMGSNGHVLLKKSELEFLKPVKENLRAVSPAADPKACNNFLKTYEKKKRAKITLTSEILLGDGSTACRMIADFVGC